MMFIRSIIISPRRQLLLVWALLRFVFFYYPIIVIIVIGVDVVRSKPVESYGRDHHRAWYPSDASKESTDICRYWPHVKGSNNVYSKVPYMNKDLKSNDLFRGLNPKIQVVQAMSLSAAESPEDRDLILIYDIFIAGDDLVLIPRAQSHQGRFR